jgi:hypothetical protein
MSVSDDDNDTYYEFFKREKELENDDNDYDFEDNSTQLPKKNTVPLNLISSTSEDTVAIFSKKHLNTTRSDLKYETLYRRMLDMCLKFFKKVRSCAKEASILHNTTLESAYSICLKDINNWKRDVIQYWKRECINRHSDIEQTYRVAFRKYMKDYYDDEDMFTNSNTGIVGRKSSESGLPTIFFNIPDFGDYFHLACVIMTKLPDVKSALILTNQASLESCVSLSMQEALFKLSQEVLRTIESREVIMPELKSSSSSSSVRPSSSSVREKPLSVREKPSSSSIREKPSSSSIREKPSSSSVREKPSSSSVREKPLSVREKPLSSSSSVRPSSSSVRENVSEEIIIFDDTARSVSNSGILRIRA